MLSMRAVCTPPLNKNKSVLLSDPPSLLSGKASQEGHPGDRNTDIARSNFLKPEGVTQVNSSG